MNMIQKFNPLLIRGINNISDINVKEYSKNAFISNINNEEYLIIKRLFNNNFVSNINEKFMIDDTSCDVKKVTSCKNTSLNFEYGDKDSIIVDMNGIDNFRFAKAIVFNDCTVRKIMLKMKLLDQNSQYLRIGASGARSSLTQPGGEVFEYSLINGKDASGLSQSVSGYLPDSECYSKNVSLHDANPAYLREERTVYLHTALLKKCNIKNTESLFIKMNSFGNNQNFLDILNILTDKLKIESYAIQICINNYKQNTDDTLIKGRVLKHIPTRPFKELQEATDIAIEKFFPLYNNTLYGVGTKYDRYEPEWTTFTNGRKYERRGHIHATIVDNNKDIIYQQHKTFHLREIYLSPSSNVEIVLTPINNVYRIYPIYQKKDKYFCTSTNKSIDILINDLSELNKI